MCLVLLLQLLDLLLLRSHLIDKCVGLKRGVARVRGAKGRQSSELPAVIIDDLNNSMLMPAVRRVLFTQLIVRLCAGRITTTAWNSGPKLGFKVLSGKPL